MRRAPPIELSAEELSVLQRTVRSSRSSVREAFRALAADGVENRAICRAVGHRPECRNGGGASRAALPPVSWTDRDADENLTTDEKSSNASSTTPCIASPSRRRIGRPVPWPSTLE